MDTSKLLSNLEDISDDFIRNNRGKVPILGRILMVLTFFEDGHRILFNINNHVTFITNSWSLPYGISFLFVMYMCLIQLIAPFCILLRRKVMIACVLLGSVILLQTLFYHMYSDLRFLIRNLSVIGCLTLLATETIMDEKPRTGRNELIYDDEFQFKSIIILVGRCYLVFMLISLIHFDGFEFLKIVELLVSFILSVCVAVGARTKLASFALAIWLFILNIFLNDWWSQTDATKIDFMKYDFFQTLSVVGGLLLVIHIGPGEVSYDDMKKQW
ncbi:unnamed protein product [Caenorhabditis angaria]|uniref:Uncharacterized protein n=1 Tax=Caenorhabditis angaria TaxID=860376 RepID=A0A9P1I1A0_9PELO|nr:unnamed protein product [Caenorhabditis angaria]